MEYNNEKWIDVEDYEGFYKVSNLGRVRSLDRISPTKLGAIKHTKGKIMNLTLKNNGYFSVMFSVLNKRKRFHVHRLVLIAFLDNEEACKHETYKGKRIKRGLYLSNKKKVINADINGSLNILKRGMKFDFDFKDCFFRPEKIDIQKKLLNFA